MTLHIFSRNEKQSTPLSYFRFLMRQNWPALVTNTILFLLLNAVILSMAVRKGIDGVSVECAFEHMMDTARIMRVLNVVLASCLAVLWGSSALNYVNSKVSVHFYHSIPLRRDSLYLCESLVKLLMFTVPCVLSHILGIFITGLTTGYWYGAVTAMSLSSIGYSILYFCFFLSIMVFCASFTGNAFSRLMSAGLVVAMPAALVACMVSILNFEAHYSQYDHYLQFALRILPPARILLFFIEVEELSTTALREIMGTLLLTVIFLSAGYFIYRKRKSELSGMPVLSKIASGLIKYTCMFCAAAVFGLIFYVFVDSNIWYCVGAVIGALLAMMLINVILTKSAKQMFQGISGMGVFSVLFVVLFVCFGVDAVGYDRYVPSAAMTKSLIVEIDGEVTLPVENAEDREFFLNYMREHLSDPEKYSEAATAVREYYYDIDYDEILKEHENKNVKPSQWEEYRSYLKDVLTELYHSRRRVSLRMTIVPHIGLENVKYIYVDPNSMGELLDRAANSENFAEVYFPDPEELQYADSMPVLQFCGMEDIKVPRKQMEETLREMRKNYSGSAYFQRSTVTTIHFRGMNPEAGRYNYVRLPYYDADPQYMEEFVSRVFSVIVLDRETKNVKEYTEPDQIREICENLHYYANGNNSPFTHEDTRYAAVVIGSEWNSYEKGETNHFIGEFLKGCVPAFIG